MTTQPLSPASFHILLALAGGEQHGYAIMRDVRTATDDAVRLGPGTLYRVIESLLKAGLIQEFEREKRSPDDTRRRYYRLTPVGRRRLRAEAQRLANAVSLARTTGVLAAEGRRS
jgi:DNA-binding PadR family transcriptional regulator